MGTEGEKLTKPCVYFFANSGPIEQVLVSILRGIVMVCNEEMHVL